MHMGCPQLCHFLLEESIATGEHVKIHDYGKSFHDAFDGKVLWQFVAMEAESFFNALQSMLGGVLVHMATASTVKSRALCGKVGEVFSLFSRI